MASIQKHEFGGFLKGGASAMVPWKNYKQIVSFWIAPKELVDDELLLGKLSFEITNVRSIMDQPNHYRSEVTIKNSSTVDGSYVLYCYFLA